MHFTKSSLSTRLGLVVYIFLTISTVWATPSPVKNGLRKGREISLRRRMIGGEMAEAEAAAKEGQKATEIEAEEAALNAKRNAFVKLYQKFKGPDTDAYKPSKAKATMKKNAKALMRTPDGLSEFSDEELRDMSKPFSDKQEREAQETLMKLWRKAAASAIKKGSPREAQRLIATGHFNGMAPYLSTVSDKKLAAAGLERKISIIGGGED